MGAVGGFVHRAVALGQQHIGCGGDRGVDVRFLMRGGDEQRFVLAAGHVHATLDQAPEVAAVTLRVAATGHVPIGHRIGIEEQGQHAADAGDLMRDPGILAGLTQPVFQTRAQSLQPLVGRSSPAARAAWRFPRPWQSDCR